MKVVPLYLGEQDFRLLGGQYKMMVRGPQQWPVIALPPNVQPARIKYTIEEAVYLAELILAGAVWCEFKRKRFLCVLPPQMHGRLERKQTWRSRSSP